MASPRSHQGSKVLVVEDEIALLDALADTLEADGMQVIRATDGPAGYIAAKEHRPPIMLLDILLPKMNGISVLRRVRSENWGKGIKVVVLTNLKENTAAVRMLGNMADAVLHKISVTPDIVRDKVRTVLNT